MNDQKPSPVGRIPLAVKLAFTVFTAVLVPKYLMDYGPTNFLYFCDIALLMTLVAVWRESPLWASMPTVGILLPQLFWAVDFFAECLGMPLTGVTGYMFDQGIPLFTRALSSFHLWLPFLLLWLVARLGYDRRAFAYWSILATVALLVCYFLMPPPPAPVDDPNRPVNINYVHGFGSKEPQTWMPPLAYLALVIVSGPVLIYGPTHLVLQRLFGDARRERAT